jgi:hypothetical protein
MEKSSTPSEKVLTITEAAEYIGKKRGYLYQLRFYDRDPVRTGNGYTKANLDAWLAERGTSRRKVMAGQKDGDKPKTKKAAKPKAEKAAKTKSAKPKSAKPKSAKATKDTAAKRAFAVANMRRPDRSKKPKTEPVAPTPPTPATPEPAPVPEAA